ncbi:MAG: hypothetical protein PHI49_00925 [Halothiobacillaceae bacterium]|nr:hypothetical protein [Halothiobacillaceae bacterium]
MRMLEHPGQGGFRQFLVGLLIAVPLCFLLWWWLQAPLVHGLNRLAGGLMELVMPGAIVEAEVRGGMLVIKTSLRLIDKPDEFLVRPFVTTGRLSIVFPIFLALTLATPVAYGQRVLRALLGSTLLLLPLLLILTLLLVQFLIAFAVNNQAMVTLPALGFYVMQTPYPAWVMHLLGVVRQLSVLVLPVLSPILIWGLLNRDYVLSMVGAGYHRNDRSVSCAEEASTKPGGAV